MDGSVEGRAILKNALVVIVNRDRENLLGFLLPDDMLIELTHDFGGLGHANARLLLSRFIVEFLVEDPFANGDAAVADIDARPGDELAHLRVAFATEGAHRQIARSAMGLHYSEGFSTGSSLISLRDFDLIDEPILLGLLCAHVIVAIGILGHLLDGLAGVKGKNVVQPLLELEHKLNLPLDVARLALGAARNLVNHDVGVGKRVAFPFVPCAEQHRRHARRDAHAIGIHITGDKLHGIVNSRAGRDRTSRRGIDVDVNVLLGILHLQKQHLVRHEISDMIVDGCADKNNAIL